MCHRTYVTRLLTNAMDMIRDKKIDVVRKVAPNTLIRSPGTTTLSNRLSPMPGDWHAMARAFNRVDMYEKWVRIAQAIKYLSGATKLSPK